MKYFDTIFLTIAFVLICVTIWISVGNIQRTREIRVGLQEISKTIDRIGLTGPRSEPIVRAQSSTHWQTRAQRFCRETASPASTVLCDPAASMGCLSRSRSRTTAWRSLWGTLFA